MSHAYDQELNDISFTQKGLSAEYEACTFIKCDFSRLDFTNISFEECTFTECNFSEVKIKNTAFKNASFRDCKMLGIHFMNANPFLLELSFDRCSLDYSSFYLLGLKGTQFAECSLKEVDFVEADLTGVSFTKCDLYKSSFERTNLSKCDFTTAVNYSLDPSINQMAGAKFKYDGLVGLVSHHKLDISL